MSQPTCDRHYLRVPASGPATDADAAAADPASEAATALAVFRACLLYIAADLRQLARSAPADKREPVTALGVLVASIATR